jgi:hypothetical protein
MPNTITSFVLAGAAIPDGRNKAMDLAHTIFYVTG